MNFAHTDPALTAVVDRWTAEADRETLNGLLDRLGRDAAGRLSELADIADKNPPVLQQFDKAGDRVDRISYHPGLLGTVPGGVHTSTACPPCRTEKGCTDGTPCIRHSRSTLASYIFVQAEFGLACPVSMTDAAARTLRMFGDPAVFLALDRRVDVDGPRSRRRRVRCSCTEIQAGTDIACDRETRAERDG